MIESSNLRNLYLWSKVIAILRHNNRLNIAPWTCYQQTVNYSQLQVCNCSYLISRSDASFDSVFSSRPHFSVNVGLRAVAVGCRVGPRSACYRQRWLINRSVINVARKKYKLNQFSLCTRVRSSFLNWLRVFVYFVLCTAAGENLSASHFGIHFTTILEWNSMPLFICEYIVSYRY